VASGDAERRRVERNLHDGAQQHLVALAINLRLTKDIVTEDPAGAAEMLGQLAEDVQATIKELRELAHGIYPPLLADNGLGDALRATAGRSPLTVYVTVADEVGRYPAEVEAAVYFSCTEALQNAAKHAQGAPCSCGCGPRPAACCSRCPTTGPASTPRWRGAATAT
jgi:signal transduction histidine kinase